MATCSVYLSPSILDIIPNGYSYVPQFLSLAGCVLSRRVKIICLTKSQPIPRKLPLAGVIRQIFTLLLQGHLTRVHNNRQVTCLYLTVAGLKIKEQVTCIFYIQVRFVCLISVLIVYTVHVYSLLLQLGCFRTEQGELSCSDKDWKNFSASAVKLLHSACRYRGLEGLF